MKIFDTNYFYDKISVTITKISYVLLPIIVVFLFNINLKPIYKFFIIILIQVLFITFSIQFPQLRFSLILVYLFFPITDFLKFLFEPKNTVIGVNFLLLTGIYLVKGTISSPDIRKFIEESWACFKFIRAFFRCTSYT